MTPARRACGGEAGGGAEPRRGARFATLDRLWRAAWPHRGLLALWLVLHEALQGRGREQGPNLGGGAALGGAGRRRRGQHQAAGDAGSQSQQGKPPAGVLPRAALLLLLLGGLCPDHAAPAAC